MPNATTRLENLLQMARATVHRDDRVAVYEMAMAVASNEWAARRGSATQPGLRNFKMGTHLTAVDHNLLTWTFYTSNWYWAAANHFRMGQRGVRTLPGKKGRRMGVWFTRDMAHKASTFTTLGKRKDGAVMPIKVWEEWWQSYKRVHRDAMDKLSSLGNFGAHRDGALWGDVHRLLERCRLAAERGPTWPKVDAPATPVPTPERPPFITKAVPVAVMLKKGRPNRVCEDGLTRWRFSRSYAAMAEALKVGEPCPRGFHVWLAEGAEHVAVATAVKAKNANISIALREQS